MEFEYDPAKSTSNRTKHGIDFARAQQLWLDSARIEVPARTTDEARWLMIGMIGELHFSAVFTVRHGKVRLISVRRSRKEEVEIYEG